jgi:hypothetical protein
MFGEWASRAMTTMSLSSTVSSDAGVLIASPGCVGTESQRRLNHLIG